MGFLRRVGGGASHAHCTAFPFSLPPNLPPGLVSSPVCAAGEKGSGYAFHAPGGKMAMSGVVPVLDVKVVDTTGAGDAYLAGGWPLTVR